MSVIHVNWQEQFKTEVLDYKWIVILDFWAEWCGPCRMLGPIMEELSNDYEWKDVKIAKVNVDENNEIAWVFQVSSIPAVFIMKDGKPVDSIIGANPKWVYINKIEALKSN